MCTTMMKYSTMTAVHFILLGLSSLLIKTSSCFSLGGKIEIGSFTGNDATSISPNLLLDTITSQQGTSCQISLSSQFHQMSKPISVEEYNKYVSCRHEDCIQLFDRYNSKTLRCELLSSTQTAQKQVDEYNIRWQASWISASSVWLFNLADAVGWKVEEKIPDSSKVTSFSWKSVGTVFQQAFQTGTIKLPVILVEGNTRLKILQEEQYSKVRISLSESIDLVREADLGRLQNRIMAQELASWLDVSRRPFDMDGKETEWAETVRERILTNVPGAGPLDVDPNEDGPGVLLSFALLLIITFGLFSNAIIEEVVGGTGQVSELCEDAVKLEVGTGYFSECFGPYGDGPFI